MAVALRSAQPVITGTPQSLTTLLSLTPQQKNFMTLAIRAGKTNAGDIYIGEDATVAVGTAGGYLDAGEALTVDLHAGWTNSDFFWFVASSPGDVLHVLRLE